MKESVYNKKSACIAEGWEVENNAVWAFNRHFPIADPIAILLNVYRTDESHETRYQAMKRAFELIWPDQVITYNYWMERMFREHCNNDTEIFTLAGGGGIGKSQTMAYVAALFWFANPMKRAVIVASTDVSSLKKRIYGYVVDAIKHATFKPPTFITNSPPPSIRCAADELQHGIFGIAAKKGDEKKTIESIKGIHPKESLLLILDEATDMPVGITAAVPNLKKGLKGRFQAIAIGNSASWDDLHGSWSYPKVGIDNIDPRKHFRWETTQPNGICLYFNPYDSPAIHETDPVKKAALSTFLITEDKLIKAEREEGVDSDGFWMFTMGFWRSRSTENKVVTEAFLKDYDPTLTADFSGRYPAVVVAGLDPAFSIGGDKCILRLAVLGHHTNGKMVLDFRGEGFIFVIKLFSNTGKSAEVQIADQVIAICAQYKVPLNTLCIDASGAGRGLADVIQLRSGGGLTPMKIYSTNVGNHKKNQPFDIKVTSPYEMWFAGRQFIGNKQIFGLDPLTYAQLHNRRYVEKNGKKDLEKKDEYKKRMAAISSLLGRSPDEADAAMLCLQSAIHHHGFFVGQEKEVVRFASEEHRHFAVALEEYKKAQGYVGNDRPFNPYKSSYSHGVGGLLKRKI
jgi:hypothetical protein